MGKRYKEYYEVEKIVSKKTNQMGQALYEIKWVGWASKWNTWEPIQHLEAVKQMVEQFEEEIQQNKQSESIVVDREEEVLKAQVNDLPQNKDTLAIVKSDEDIPVEKEKKKSKRRIVYGSKKITKNNQMNKQINRIYLLHAKRKKKMMNKKQRIERLNRIRQEKKIQKKKEKQGSEINQNDEVQAEKKLKQIEIIEQLELLNKIKQSEKMNKKTRMELLRQIKKQKKLEEISKNQRKSERRQIQSISNKSYEEIEEAKREQEQSDKEQSVEEMIVKEEEVEINLQDYLRDMLLRSIDMYIDNTIVDEKDEQKSSDHDKLLTLKQKRLQRYLKQLQTSQLSCKVDFKQQPSVSSEQSNEQFEDIFHTKTNPNKINLFFQQNELLYQILYQQNQIKKKILINSSQIKKINPNWIISYFEQYLI